MGDKSCAVVTFPIRGPAGTTDRRW